MIFISTFSAHCLQVILLGDYRRDETPVPIPNTEVKISFADGTVHKSTGEYGVAKFFFLKINFFMIKSKIWYDFNHG